MRHSAPCSARNTGNIEPLDLAEYEELLVLTGNPVSVPVTDELYGAVHHVQGNVQPCLLPLLQAVPRHPQEPGQAVSGSRNMSTGDITS